MAAKVIVIEGIDGSGKDTAIESLVKYFKTKNLKVSVLKSLSGKILGPVIREKLQDPNTNKKQLTSMFIAELFEVEEVLKNKLETYDYVICNRWIYSTMAYNSNSLAEMNAIMVLSATEVQPDYIFYLDIPVDVAIDRISVRNKKEIFENKDKLEQVRDNYEIISSLRSIKNFIRIDATQKAIDVAKEIINKIIPES